MATYRQRAVGTCDVGGVPPIVGSGLEDLSHRIFNSIGVSPNFFAEAVIYAAPTGPVTIYADVQFDQQSVNLDTEGKRRARYATVFLSYAALQGIAGPTRRDTITIRGEEWGIDDIGEREGGCWEMRVVRTEAQEKTGIRRRTT